MTSIHIQVCLQVQAWVQVQACIEVSGFVYKMILMCREDKTLFKEKSDLCLKLMRDVI